MSADLKKAARWMARELKAVKEYPQDQEKSGFVDRDRKRLADYAAGGVTLGHVTVALDSLANVRGASGCAVVLAGDDRGFADVDAACLYNSILLTFCATAR